MPIILLLIMGLYADKAYGFNPILFLDPSFISFILLEVPLVAVLLISTFELIVFRKIFRGYFLKNLAIGDIATKIIRTNFSVMVFNIILSFILVIVLSKALSEAPAIILWLGVLYFAAILAHISLHAKCTMLARILSKEVKGDNDKLLKSYRKKIFFINALSYIILYSYLYYLLV